MSELKLNVDIDPSARTVDIEFLDGPRIPTLDRSQAYALLEALQGALPHMAVDLSSPNAAHQPTRRTDVS